MPAARASGAALAPEAASSPGYAVQRTSPPCSADRKARLPPPPQLRSRRVMGRKVHPVGFRLKINKTWDGRWFAEGKDYVNRLHQDFGIRNLVHKMGPP